VHASWAGPTLLAYPTAQIAEMLRSPDYLRFSFVRNPYSRLVSAWKPKLAWDDPEVTGIARRVFNPTQPMPLAAVYDPQLARRVYDLHIADFETFGYHKDSWRYA
jgi:hypothetical protein